MMAQAVLFTDDTPAHTLAPGTGKTKLARFWVYAVDPRPHAGSAPPAAFYCYSPDRRASGRAATSPGSPASCTPTLSPATTRYNQPELGKPPRIQHAACWAYARRKLFEVHEATKSPIAQEALMRIQALYAIEAEITGKSAAERQAVRQVRSVPVLGCSGR